MITSRNLSITLCLLFTIHISNSMEKHDDHAILPITINVKKGGNIVYSTQFNIEQLQYLGTLYEQYNREKSNILTIRGNFITTEDFVTIEKVTMLLAAYTSRNEKEQKRVLKKCFRESQVSEETVLALCSAASSFNCPLLYDACKSHYMHMLMQRAS